MGGGTRRQLADLAAPIRSMRVAAAAMQRRLAESDRIVLRLMSENGGAAPGEQAPPRAPQGS